MVIIGIKCSSEQFASIRDKLIPIGNECIFKNWNEPKECHSSGNCKWCFSDNIQRIKTDGEIQREKDVLEQERKTAKKPPIGIMSKKIWIEIRKEELSAAIQRYVSEGFKVPIEWIEEYNEFE